MVTVLFDWYQVKQQMQSPFTFHNIEEKVSFLCQGKTIDKVGKKKQLRRPKEVKEIAPWFLESHELKPSFLKL